MGSTCGLKQRGLSLLCFYERDKAELSYLKSMRDVKKNIINIIIIIKLINYYCKSISYTINIFILNGFMAKKAATN